MKLVMKTRDTADKEFMYEVHKEGCAHLRFNKQQIFVSDKYENAEAFINADMGTDIPREAYKIMPCV